MRGSLRYRKEERMRIRAWGVVAAVLIGGLALRAGLIDSMVKKRKEGADTFQLSGNRAGSPRAWPA
jgi:hypothetical protein